MATPVADSTDETLADLLTRIADNRDVVAFEKVFRQIGPKVRGYMTALTRDRQFADELTQETMASVWRKAAQFDPARGTAETWVFTIARNQRIDAFRRTRRPDFDPADPAFVPEPEPSAEVSISGQQDADRLRRAMQDLPAEQLTLLRLSFFEDRSQSTIADDLGIPLGTVKSRMRLAFSKLRSVLEKEL